MNEHQPYLIDNLGEGARCAPRLKQLPERETPGFRVLRDAEGCSLAELLAVIIGGPAQIEAAEELLARFGSIQKIARAHPAEIGRLRGLSGSSALRLKAALSLGCKLLQPEEDKPVLQTPADAARLLMPMLAHRDQEFLVVLPVDTRRRVMDVVEVYHGSVHSAMVRVGELFKPVLQRNAVAALFAHNHPSCDPSPSPQDIAVTEAMVQAGKLLDILVIDHLVVGLSGWVSLRERGAGFP